MSIKKTWFSYILWLFATGFCILFTYSYITGIIDCYSFEPLKPLGVRIGISVAFIIGIALIFILLQLIRDRITVRCVPKWGRRLFSILVLCGITALFVITRCKVLWSTILEDIVPMELYDAAKVMLGSGTNVAYESYSVIEGFYINILSGLFLFLGNKMELMLYFQILLQVASFLLLLFIGRSLQKGVFGVLPALVYSLSQYCMDAVVCLYADNFCFFMVVLGIALICLLEKLWKNKTVTYFLIVLAGIVFAVFCAVDAYPHVGDWNSVFEFWFWDKMANGGAAGFWCFLILVALVFFYCMSFWKTKTDNASAYILPVVFFSVITYLNLYADSLMAVFMLLRIYMSFMAAEGLRILFEAKPKVLTGHNMANGIDEQAPEQAEINDYTWTEMKEIMNQKEETVNEADCVNEITESAEVDDGCEDTGVIRVSDILKAANAETLDAEKNVSITETESRSEETVVDKMAMIENVLPIPKKHVSRTLDYAFEPTEDMMHYDIDLENDTYDYE